MAEQAKQIEVDQTNIYFFSITVELKHADLQMLPRDLPSGLGNPHIQSLQFLTFGCIPFEVQPFLGYCQSVYLTWIIHQLFSTLLNHFTYFHCSPWQEY